MILKIYLYFIAFILIYQCKTKTPESEKPFMGKDDLKLDTESKESYSKNLSEKIEKYLYSEDKKNYQTCKKDLERLIEKRPFEDLSYEIKVDDRKKKKDS